VTKPRVHVVGCGRTARSLARVLQASGAVRVGQVVNRSLASSTEAVEFIGAGEPADALDEMAADDWLMLGLPDGQLGEAAECLAGQLSTRPGLVFHLSGSVSSEVLSPLGDKRAAVHPLRAFSDPGRAVAHFSGTWCVAEGSAAVLETLGPVFERCGARFVTFAPTSKAAWHGATVAASNFLVVINALARELAVQAGVSEDDARRMLADLQAGTLASLADMPAAQALTGPFERADEVTCRRLHDVAHEMLSPSRAALFDTLARGAVELAQDKRGKRCADREILAGLTSRRD
jgi:predicted short-subunit dehydrogenase-like oxidoreductase (DUF2520 family)